MSDERMYSRRSGPRDRQLRAGDAEREAVAEILRREHLAGRIDSEEFDERIARCLAAKTYGELDELIRDFPVDEPPVRLMVRRPGWRLWPLPFVFLPVVVAAIVFSHGRAVGLLVPLFIWLAIRRTYGRRWKTDPAR